jgi:dinuclear metal center YbgI/SA1388 family protein
MPVQLSQLLASFESLWPVAGAEEWDKPGLTTGSSSQPISNVLLSVDVTLEVLEEAKSLGCELVLSHHPILLKPVNFLTEDHLKGELVSFATRNSIATFSAHTNADIVVGGVSDVLASRLGLMDAKPLVQTGENIGHGRIGKLAKPMTLADFADVVSAALPSTNAPIRVAGTKGQIIETVAVVGGAGDSFIQAAAESKADVLITSDLRHHVVLDAINDPLSPLALIDISHFAAESLWLEPTRAKLSTLLPDVGFTLSKISTDPWSFTVYGSANSDR